MIVCPGYFKCYILLVFFHTHPLWPATSPAGTGGKDCFMNHDWHMGKLTQHLLLLSVPVLLFGMDDTAPSFQHTVKKEESVSLICIDYYGHYTTDMGKAMLMLNPHVKNINLIVPGQELILPTPTAAVHGTVYQAGVATDSSAEVKVYTGEVSVKGAAKRDKRPPSGFSEVSGPTEVPGPHEVSMEEWTQIVRTMQRITIDGKGTPLELTEFSRDPSNKWEQWNEERDRRISGMFGEDARK